MKTEISNFMFKFKICFVFEINYFEKNLFSTALIFRD